MKLRTDFLFTVFFICAIAAAQESQIVAPPVRRPHTLSSGTRTFPNGIRIDNRIMADDVTDASFFPKSTGPQHGLGEWTTWDGPVYHHFFFIDQRYFGYDLEADTVPGTDRIRLTFEPLSVDWTGEGVKV